MDAEPRTIPARDYQPAPRRLTFEVVTLFRTYVVWAVVERWDGSAYRHVTQARFASWRAALRWAEMITAVWDAFRVPAVIQIRRSY